MWTSLSDGVKSDVACVGTDSLVSGDPEPMETPKPSDACVVVEELEMVVSSDLMQGWVFDDPSTAVKGELSLEPKLKGDCFVAETDTLGFAEAEVICGAVCRPGSPLR